jgi:hypothetical protein
VGEKDGYRAEDSVASSKRGLGYRPRSVERLDLLNRGGNVNTLGMKWGFYNPPEIIAARAAKLEDAVAKAA